MQLSQRYRDFSQPNFSQLYRLLLIKFQPCKSWQSPVRVRVRYILGSYLKEKNRKVIQKISAVVKSRRAIPKPCLRSRWGAGRCPSFFAVCPAGNLSHLYEVVSRRGVGITLVKPNQKSSSNFEFIIYHLSNVKLELQRNAFSLMALPNNHQLRVLPTYQTNQSITRPT